MHLDTFDLREGRHACQQNGRERCGRNNSFFRFHDLSSIDDYLATQHIHAAGKVKGAGSSRRKADRYGPVERQFAVNAIGGYHDLLSTCTVCFANKRDIRSNSFSQSKLGRPVTTFRKFDR